MSTELEATLSASLLQKIREGSIDLNSVVAQIAGKIEEDGVVPVSNSLPAAITPAQSVALQRLAEVYGKVVPTERRELTPTELTAILDERNVIDTILKMAKDRKEVGIRDTVLNHFDIKWERVSGEDAGTAPRTEDGHYLIASKQNVPDTDKSFSWEVSGGAPTITDEVLRDLDARGEIDHALYVRVTDQVRVLNEQKLLDALGELPEETAALISKAATPAKQKGSLYVRKAE